MMMIHSSECLSMILSSLPFLPALVAEADAGSLLGTVSKYPTIQRSAIPCCDCFIKQLGCVHNKPGAVTKPYRVVQRQCCRGRWAPLNENNVTQHVAPRGACMQSRLKMWLAVNNNEVGCGGGKVKPLSPSAEGCMCFYFSFFSWCKNQGTLL